METPHANLCASMRHINGVYTQAYNRRHKVVGHLFQGRYKALVVNRDAYYLELIRYIHLNPWRAKMVRQIGDFKYSGHRAVIDKEWAKRWKDWYDREVILKEFGRKENEAVKRYIEFVNLGKGMAIHWRMPSEDTRWETVALRIGCGRGLLMVKIIGSCLVQDICGCGLTLTMWYRR
jgi:hypothetical protein